MKTTAIALSRLRLATGPNLAARLPDFIALTKPRVMALAVFTALVGLVMAPSRLDPLLGSVAVLAIAVGAGAAGVLNMWYDADIDAVMTRTAGRPIPRGAISRLEALAFGLVLACSAVAVLAFAANIIAAALLAFAIFFYVVVYTMWLKRATPQNIVIGGAAGALPPLIGWAAARGEIAIEPLILFLIVFLWTPPHFWALSLTRADLAALGARRAHGARRARHRSDGRSLGLLPAHHYRSGQHQQRPGAGVRRAHRVPGRRRIALDYDRSELQHDVNRTEESGPALNGLRDRSVKWRQTANP